MSYVDWYLAKELVGRGLIILSIATALIAPIQKKFFMPERLNRTPNKRRWWYIIPAAFIYSTIAEMIPRFVFSLYEISLNSTMLYRSEIDLLAYSGYAPLFFVIGGVCMAPAHKGKVYIALGGLKVVVALYNIYVIWMFVTQTPDGWAHRAPFPNTLLWWSAPVNVLSVLLIIGYGLYLNVNSREKPQKHAVTCHLNV